MALTIPQRFIIALFSAGALLLPFISCLRTEQEVKPDGNTEETTRTEQVLVSGTEPSSEIKTSSGNGQTSEIELNSKSEASLTELSSTELSSELKLNSEPDPTRFNDGTPIVTSKTLYDGKDSILLTFAGDIMAHTPNFSRGHYDKIYEDIESLLKESEFAFANLETPVDDDRPYSNYPNFNVQHPYADAAINAGFNVFSLANNHTNDQGLQGIRATKKYFDGVMESTAESERPVYASGLKASPEDPFSICYIEEKGWRILFLAMTEILNTPNYSSYINYIRTSKAARAEFIKQIGDWREQYPCELFVLSLHCAEPEYILTIDKTQTQFYHDLLDAGVDILWANHPHVAKDWEVLVDEDSVPRKLIFYAMGNSISGQRTNPSFNAPGTARDYTGDGYMAQLRYIRDEQGIHIAHINPVLITTYINPDRLYLIRRLDENFITELREAGRSTWATYLEARKKLMERIKGKTVWQ